MAINTSVKGNIDLRIVGLRALNMALGVEGARAFMEQAFSGRGDLTKEKYERPEQSFEEVTAELWKIDAEMRAAGEYQ
jgi:hypothetical protein